MNPSRPARALAAALVALSIGAVPAAAFTNDAVKDAQAVLDRARRAFDLGQAGQEEVLMATAFLLDMKFRAKELSRKSYCEEALPNLRQLGKILEDPIRRSSISDLIASKRHYYELSVLCRGK